MSNPTSTALAPFKSIFDRAMPHLQQALPATVAKYLTGERLIKITISALSRNPRLLQCTPESVLRAVMESASLGLEPTGGALGQAYLVPFGREAQLIIGYRGKVALACRSGEIESVEAHVVHARDVFEFEHGLVPRLVHKPLLVGDRGDMIAVYSVARLKSGRSHVEVMRKDEVDKIRSRSRASNCGPWVTDYEEMAKKTVVHRASKYWPMSTDLATAIDIENRAESAASYDIIDLPSELGEIIDAEPEPKLTTDRVKAKLKGKAEKKTEKKKAAGEFDLLPVLRGSCDRKPLDKATTEELQEYLELCSMAKDVEDDKSIVAKLGGHGDAIIAELDARLKTKATVK